MKIGFDAKRAFHNNTGLGNYSRTIIRQLTGMFPGHEYYLFTPSSTDSFFAFPPENTRVIEPSRPVDRAFRSLWRSVNMGKDVLAGGIDIFHGLSNELPMDIAKSHAKSVVTIHDLIFLRYPHLYRKTDRIIYRSKFLNSARIADRVVAISEQTRSDIISFLGIDPQKIEVIYQSCNPAFYGKASEQKKQQIREKYKLPEKYILYVGTIEERKNLLKIIMARHESGIDIPLVAIGRPTKYMDLIRKYIEDNKCREIYFFSQASQEDLPAIYQMSSAFLYPSSFEGFGIPVLEALNSGIPVIAATGSCLEETGGINSVYINPVDTKELGEAIIKVITDEVLRERMITEGYKFALNFSKEKTAGRMMELYTQLIDDRRY